MISIIIIHKRTDYVYDNAEMKQRIGVVMSVAPWTELNLSSDEIKIMRYKYDDITKIMMIINMNR